VCICVRNVYIRFVVLAAPNSCIIDGVHTVLKSVRFG